MNANCGFSSNILILDGSNWVRWNVLMKSLFGTQDVIEIMQDGYEELSEDIINAQRTTFKELRKKDYKALFYI